MVENTTITIMKSGGRPIEEFNPSKLHDSVLITCRSVHTPEGQAEEIAKEVTLNVMHWCESRSIITASDIRRQVIKQLQPLHTDAAFFYQHYKTVL